MERLLIAADSALRTLFAPPQAARTLAPIDAGADAPPDPQLSEEERRHAAGLMRVNHVGEVCAQALYTSQALTARDERLRAHFEAASREETDHLAWTADRLHELGSRTSVLNPLWYAGAFAIGLVAGRVGGDRVSLGFVVETERQVEAHLASHLDRLPAGDQRSRQIVAQMQADEARHADEAQAAGAVALPRPVQALMRAAARVMTRTAYHL